MQFLALAFVLGVVAARPQPATPNCSQVKNNCAPKVSTFCSSYLHITPATSTATVSSGVATSTSTFIGGTTTTTIKAASCGTGGNKVKRAATATPNCLKANSPASASSACSCLVTSSTVTHTTTVASSTTVITTTVQITSTFTSLAVPPCATVTQQGTSYHDYVAACGVVENGNNPGGAQAFISHFPGSLAACSAINSCAYAAASPTTSLGVLPSQLARSFDVHLLKSGQWECVGYHGTSQDPGYFNVPNDNVLAAYGYAL